MKGMIKFLMMSRAYRRSSSAPEDLYRRDPDNRLLARGPCLPDRRTQRIRPWRRVACRHFKIGGPSTRPYMPAGVWSETNRYGNLRNYKADTGEGLYRRSMYTIRSQDGCSSIDAPVRRSEPRNLHAQAFPHEHFSKLLALMNEVTHAEAA